MAKQAFISLLLFVAIWIAVSVKAEVATPRKLAENFQGQTVVELIKLPLGVVVPSGEKYCYPPHFDQCDPGCTCENVIGLSCPVYGVCVPEPQTHETARKMVGKFQDQTVVEKLIKLPQGVVVPSGEKCCYPPHFDQCDPGCPCYVHGFGHGPVYGFCGCPEPQTHETARKMVGNFQDQTVVEKLIKLPQRVGVPVGGQCYPPPFGPCDPGCWCVVTGLWPAPVTGVCYCPEPQTHETASKMVGKFQDQTVVEKLIKEMEGYL